MTKRALSAGWASATAEATETGTKYTADKHTTDRQNIAPNFLNSRNIDPASDDIRQLAASLADNQLQSIPVVPAADFLSWEGFRELYAEALAQLAYVDQAGRTRQPDYVAIGGGRRLAAAAVGNIARLDISIKRELSREDFLRLTVVENLDRRGLTPYEEALQIKILRDATGDSYEALGAKLGGRSLAFIAQRLDLLTLAPPLLAELAAGTMRVTQARTLLSRIKGETPEGGTLPEERQWALWEEISSPPAPPAAVLLPGKSQEAEQGQLGAAGQEAEHQGAGGQEAEPGGQGGQEAEHQGAGGQEAEQGGQGGQEAGLGVTEQPDSSTSSAPDSSTSSAPPAPPAAPTKAPRGRPVTPADQKIAAVLRGKPREAIVAALVRHFPDAAHEIRAALLTGPAALGMTKPRRNAIIYAGQPAAEIAASLTRATIPAGEVAAALDLMAGEKDQSAEGDAA